MGSVVDLSQVKKQASLRLWEKLRAVRLLLTDVTEAELLTEEATNNEPSGPETRTMALISQAAFEVDDYWRIVEVLHKRLSAFDKKRWRMSFKTLVLLEYLLTHGPKSIAGEFQCEKDFLKQLVHFQYVDDRGVDWGMYVRRKVDKILELLNNEELLMEERNHSRKVSRVVRFGSFSSKDSSSVSVGSGSSRTSSAVTFGSSNPAWNATEGKTGMAFEKEGRTTYESHKDYGDDHSVRSNGISRAEFSTNTSFSDQFFSAEQLSDTCTSVSDAMNSLQTEKCNVGHVSNHEWNPLKESDMSNWDYFGRTGIQNQSEYDEEKQKNNYRDNISPSKNGIFEGFDTWNPRIQTGPLLNSSVGESYNCRKIKVYSNTIYPFDDVNKEITECLLSKTPNRIL